MGLFSTSPSDAGSTFRCETGTFHTEACCGRRAFLTGTAALAFGTMLDNESRAQAPTAKPYRIDTHHHFSSPGFIAAITEQKTGQVPLMRTTVEKSLEDMDKSGVATAIVSISEPSVFFGNYDAARALARETNDFAARMMKDYPGRFGLFATLPLPDVEASLREVEYALDTLKADGVCMMTDYEGKLLGDPAFTPVMEELNRRKAIVYTHPSRNPCCRNLIPNVPDATIELGTDTTRTIASLLFTGTALRFPDIKFIFSHAGGTMPFLIQRFTALASQRKEQVPEGAIHYLQKFYYDTSSASTVYPLASLMKLVSTSQVLLGTDFPFSSAAAISTGLRQTGMFTESDLQAIERDNAVRLMPRYRT